MSNKVFEIEEALDQILGDDVPSGDQPTPSADEKRVAMFILTVNATASEPYVGFELKASTNNFATGGQDIKTQFYAQSEIANTGTASIDKMRMYALTSYGTSDRRSYTRIPNTLSWSHKLTQIVVLVDSTCLIRNPTGNWLNESNEELNWCYCRTRNNDPAYEVEDGTSKSLWRPIVPVRWFKALPSWAQ